MTINSTYIYQGIPVSTTVTQKTLEAILQYYLCHDGLWLKDHLPSWSYECHRQNINKIKSIKTITLKSPIILSKQLKSRGWLFAIILHNFRVKWCQSSILRPPKLRYSTSIHAPCSFIEVLRDDDLYFIWKCISIYSCRMTFEKIFMILPVIFSKKDWPQLCLHFPDD